MGVAIIFVLLYHMGGATDVPFLVKATVHYLYIGVDIFICASGFGLCYSLKKYSLRQFYKRRFLRLYPSYAILAMCVTFIHVYNGAIFSTWDIFCQFSTLQYYNLGGVFFDWYLSAIIILYLFFPLLFKYRTTYTPTILLFLCFILITIIPQGWASKALIARIGIFAYGILMYQVLEEGKDAKHILINGAFFALIAPLPYIYLRFGRIDFVFSAGLTPMLMYLMYCVFQYLQYKKRLHILLSIISWLGKYSLALYVANVASMQTMQHIFHIDGVVCYYGLQIVYTFIMLSAECYLIRPLTHRLI